MTRFYCDQCGTEIAENEHGRLEASLGCVTVECLTAVRGTWNGGHVCHACIRDAVGRGETDKRKWKTAKQKAKPCAR
jgi:hypothetical protein